MNCLRCGHELAGMDDTHICIPDYRALAVRLREALVKISLDDCERCIECGHHEPGHSGICYTGSLIAPLLKEADEVLG